MALKKRTASGGSSRHFKYKARDPDSVKKRSEREGGLFDSIFKGGVETFRPKQGTNVVRFVPPTWDDAQHYGLDVYVHQYIGADSGSYLCLRKHKNKPCPICKAAEEANAAGEEDEAKALRAVNKVVSYVVDRDERKPTLKLWPMSFTMDKDITTLACSDRSGKVLAIDHPDTGYDISFKRTGQQLNTRYIGMAIDREDSPLADTTKEIDKLMAQAEENPIPDLLVFRDAAYLENVVNGKVSKKQRDEDDEEEEEEDDRPSRRRRSREEEEDEAPKRRRRSEPEEEEEEEEDDAPKRRRRSEPEEEEEEEEERPRRRRRSEPEEEEEETEEEEEEEEEEERPKRRGRRSKPEEEEEEEEDDPPKRRRRREEPEDEEEEEETEEPEEEEDDPPKRRRRSEPEEEEEEPEDDEETEDEEEEEEERPRRKPASKAPAKKQAAKSSGRVRVRGRR